jgi:SAM-dependent methyltransferase
MNAGPEHWEKVYAAKPEAQTSWFRPHLDESLRLLDQLALPTQSPIIDVGTGRSTLVDDLLARGFTDLTALDISGEALAQSHARLGESAARIRWIESDLLEARLPRAHYALWHDRAVFHFLTEPAGQARYVAIAARALRPGGHLLLATFAPDGPDKCSGLPTCRYDAAALAARFAPAFEPVADSREQHLTPFDTTQAFTYVVLRRTETDPA